MTKPTILIVIHHYLPGWKTGGPVRTISNLVELLGNHFNFKILTTDRDRGDAAPYPNITSGRWYTVGKAQIRYLSPREIRLPSLVGILQECKYDALYLNSVLSGLVIRVLLLRRLACIQRRRTIIAPRGHLDAGALSLKTNKKHAFLIVAKLIRIFDDLEWHASSIQEASDITTHFGSKQTSRIHVIPNLVSIPEDKNISSSTGKSTGILHLIYLSRVTVKKGLDVVLRALRGVSGNVTFDIYGHIEDDGYWAECQSLMKTLPQTIKASYKGVVAPDRIHELIASYHLFVLPTLGENFGHVIVEALIAGCPVLISDRTPWKGLHAWRAGWIIPLTELAQYSKRIQEMVDMDAKSFAALRNNASAYGRYVSNSSKVADDTKRFLQTVVSSNKPTLG